MRRLAVLPLLCLLGCADGGTDAFVAEAPAALPEACPAPNFAEARAFTVENVVLDRAGVGELRADLFTPEGPGPHPGLAIFHGAAWVLADQRLSYFVAKHYAESGFVVLNVNYRKAPATKIPGQVRDGVCAVRRLRAMAEEVGLAKDCVGVMGDSSGGHVAAMVALEGDREDLQEGCEDAGGETANVRFAMPHYGVFDWDAMIARYSQAMEVFFFPFVFAPEDDFRAYSPIRYADRRPEVDFFVSHGTHDKLAPFAQSTAFADALEAGGHRVARNWIAGADHSYLISVLYFSPPGRIAQAAADAFLAESLARTE
ncbi:MAG: alpha/beta hydrolase [Candidatus Methylomirabilis sp.]|nr:alpha/beta hydrolase [Deltaproteobacteria bacterium]